MKYIKDNGGILCLAYNTPESAINAYIEAYVNWCGDWSKISPNMECSLGVGKDNAGNYIFCVGGAFDFTTNCTLTDVKTCKSWYKDEWLEEVFEDDIVGVPTSIE